MTRPPGNDANPGASAKEQAVHAPADTRKSLFFAYGGYFFRYLYLLILIPYYGRVLGAAEYGKVLAAMSLFGIVWLSVNYGFSIVGMRNVAAARDKAEVGREFGRQIKARLLLSLVGLLIGAVGTLASGVLSEQPLYGLLATLLGLLTAFNLGWYFQGSQRFRTSILLEVAGFIISLILILSLVRDASDGPLVMLSLVVSACLTTTVAYTIALGQIGYRQVRFRGARQLLRSATVIFVSDGASRLMMTGATLLLSLFATATHVGHFGAAERIATLVISLMVPANQVLVGTVAHRLGRHDAQDDAFRLMRRALFLLGLFGVAACSATLLLAPWLLPLVLGPQFQASAPILQLFSLVFPLVAVNQVIRLYVLLPLRMDARVAQCTLIGAACNLSVILLLAADFQGYGVAAARIVGELVTAGALLVVLRRQGLLERLLRRNLDKDAANCSTARLGVSEQGS